MRRLLWPNADAEGLAREMDAIMQDSLTPVFVTERPPGGGLCGLLQAGTPPYADGCDPSPVGYIEGWYVDEDTRGKGIGRALVAEAEDWAREQGCTSWPRTRRSQMRPASRPISRGLQRDGTPDPFRKETIGRLQ